MTLLPIVRRDTLPEGTKYPDNGCAVMTNPCLECVLPMCLEDLNMATFLDEKRKLRNVDIRSMFKRRVPVAEIARTHGVSARTIHRITSKKERVR